MPPPSAAYTRADVAPPAPPSGPPVWPSAYPQQQPPEPPSSGPNYLVAAAIVAIAVLLTAGGIGAALVLTGDGGDGTSQPSAKDSADARRLIRETAQLNREVIDLEKRIARQGEVERAQVAELRRQRREAQRLAAAARRDLSELRRVQAALVDANVALIGATRSLDRFRRTQDQDDIDTATGRVRESATNVGEATDAYEQAERAPARDPAMQVDPAELPAVKLDVPSDAKVRIFNGVEGSVDSLTGVGDVNGDEREDVLATSNSEGIYSGEVVFGQPEGEEVGGLTQLGSDGFTLETTTTWEAGGAAAAGDVDGDGNDDIVLPAPAQESVTGSAWVVVFGSDETTAVDLDGPDERTTRIKLAEFLTQGPGLGSPSIRGVGDVNGDGSDDIAVGAPADGIGGPGGVWVVTNVARGGTVSLDKLGGDGFRIDGAPADSAFGGAVSGAGDVNRDGTDDLVVGAPSEGTGRGAAYVIFGSEEPGDVDIADLGDRGFALRGAGRMGAGGEVTGLGDVNDDRLADFAVSATDQSPAGRNSAGVVYVVFGRRETTPVRLSDPRVRRLPDRWAGRSALRAGRHLLWPWRGAQARRRRQRRRQG